ncbi:hypothetical protein LCGC14_2773700 [marine sediment metagenome]|uniref:HTH cro/C1-type domain-containing protein n=1 Tax=marine sediment metagenome TaxID=412755 RepID=A0A0F9B453_9ZZZZ
MAGTLHTSEYHQLVRTMVDARLTKGLSQASLATRLRRPPSFIAKVELCERRLDVIEFFIWISALTDDPSKFVKTHLPNLPEHIP